VIYSILRETAKTANNNTALVTSNNQAYTYEALLKRVHQWAHYLKQKGIKANQRIGLMTSDDDAHVFFYLAASAIGACYVPLDPEMPAAALTDGLKTLDLDTLFVTAPTALEGVHCELIDESECDRLPEDLPMDAQIQGEKDCSYIMSSSGSTGTKKWIPILGTGLKNYWAPAVKDLLQLTNKDSILSTRSPAFDAKIFELLEASASGASLYLMAHNDRKDMKKIVATCLSKHITTLLMVPSQLESAQFNQYLPALAAAGLKHLIVTGEACNWTLVQLCKSLGIHVWNAYGPTEATFGLSLFDVTTVYSDSIDKTLPVPIGPPLPPVRYRIKDRRLLIASPFLSPGYLNPEASKGDFTMLDGERWFDTGDLFSEVNGLLYFEGRASFESHLKIGGVKVNPTGIEQVINQYPTSPLQAVVVVKDWLGHPKPIAYICSSAPLDENALSAYLDTKFTPAERPVCFPIAEIPYLANDKIDRKHLLLMEDDPNKVMFKDKATEVITNAKLEQVLKLWCQLFHVDSLSPSQNFLALGGDSMTANELVVLTQKIDPSYQYSDFLSLSSFTPHAMALQLQQKKNPRTRMAIVTPHHINPSASKAVFMCPPLLGEGCFTYKSLAEHYSDAFNVTVYGLSSPVLFDNLPLPKTLDEEAEDFYNAMKATQPEGPYHLFGFSYGALLAYKVAEICFKRGDKVASLELMDGFPPEVVKQMPADAHTRLFYSMVQFIIKVLNKKPYNESIDNSLLMEQRLFEKLLPSIANAAHAQAKNEGKLTAIKDKDLFDKHNLIQLVFEMIRRELKNPKSIRMLDLAERHLNFMFTQPAPSELLPLKPTVYQTNPKQDYWRMMDSIQGLIPRAPDRRFLFWNHYFPVVRRNGRKLDLDHLELLAKQVPDRATTAQSFWVRKQDVLFAAVDSFGPVAFYTCERQEGGYVYNMHFCHSMEEMGITSKLHRLQIDFKVLRYQLTSELFTQEDAASHAMSGYQFFVPTAKKANVDAWLAASRCPKKEINACEYQELAIKAPIEAVYLTLMDGSQPVLDLSFDLPTSPSFHPKSLKIPKGLHAIPIPNKPGILYLALINVEQTKNIFDTIEQCKTALGQFVAVLTTQLHPGAAQEEANQNSPTLRHA